MPSRMLSTMRIQGIAALKIENGSKRVLGKVRSQRELVILANEEYPESEERGLNTADELALIRANSVGITHLDYYDGPEILCALDLYERDFPETFCENITRNVCDEELVLRFKRFKENCTDNREYCSTKQRTQTFFAESVLCFKSRLTICPDGNRKVAVCTEIPQTVTITEKKQKCKRRRGRKIVEDFKTEKFCITYANGTWTCMDLKKEKESHRRKEACITSESDCKLDNNAEPICQKVPGIPRPIKLSETLCEECVDGRMRTEPVLVSKEICRVKNETFCVESIHKQSKWRKICTKTNGAELSQKDFYRIEIAPEHWITTEYLDVADAFREVQGEAERQYRKLILEEDKVESATPPSTTQDPVLQNFIVCANDHTKCKFT
ncbi:unnamed protein product [Lepeophtheirus salmonis]|uniref:(salmon louse) hypothetical protein n=1 Tax=Lepeophtheirus salmonis TaxID=72036 RepID=A0A7R8HAC1_LEPSM|nr:unnamed protein product [Lepeophtheirus salmonis]CAF2969553.1 unnamed protein product [Lepeophtheirus salmonis]